MACWLLQRFIHVHRDDSLSLLFRSHNILQTIWLSISPMFLFSFSWLDVYTSLRHLHLHERHCETSTPEDNTRWYIGMKSPLKPKRTFSITRKIQQHSVPLTAFWSLLHTLECGPTHEGRGGEFKYVTRVKETEFIIRFLVLRKLVRTRITAWNCTSGWLKLIVVANFAEDEICCKECLFFFFCFVSSFYSFFFSP
jgi:hypothetical protein